MTRFVRGEHLPEAGCAAKVGELYAKLAIGGESGMRSPRVGAVGMVIGGEAGWARRRVEAV